jgi:AcrR family transcriptional regulator
MPDLPPNKLPSASIRERNSGGKTRQRSDEARAAILKAALELLDELGYAALSMEAIADRSGSAKTTIYRWWPSKAAVVLDAYIHTRARQIAVKSTGELSSDLERFVAATCRALQETSAGPAMAALMAESQNDPKIAQVFRDTWIESRRAVLKRILKEGLARGELRNGVDLEVVADCIYGPIWYRLLNRHGPLNTAFAKMLAWQVLAGVAREGTEARNPV